MLEFCTVWLITFLGSVHASIHGFCVNVCIVGQPNFSSQNDHFQLVAPLINNQIVNWITNWFRFNSSQNRKYDYWHAELHL